MPAWVVAGLLGVGASALLIVAGGLLHLSHRQRTVLIVVGALGFLASVGWLVLAAYADATLQ